MWETIELLPTGFWLATLVLLGLVAEVVFSTQRPWSKPLLVAYGTVGMWYHMDIIYNDPAEFHSDFKEDHLNEAFMLVCWFLICLRIFVGLFAGPIISGVKQRSHTPWTVAAAREKNLLVLLAGVWAVLMLYALFRVNGDIMAILCPPLSAGGNPWDRAAVGGAWDFIVSTASYTHLAICGMAGILVANAKSREVRRWALAFWIVACPVFIFGRNRNQMLACLLPGVMAYIFLAKASIARKTIISVVLFAIVAIWFSLIVSTRKEGFTFLKTGEIQREDIDSHHHGLDMYRELCYLTEMLENGRYKVNWGERYFAEAVGVIPRGLWPGKPYIGIDYAIARGYGGGRGSSGVHATMSTGMIGQGVANFGTIYGPMAAAAILAAWVCLLGRFWLQRRDINRLLLCLLGMGLTINMGRDLTLLVVFPLVFAYIGIRIYEHFFQTRNGVPLKR